MILHHSKSSLNTIKKEKKEIDLIQKECIKLIQSNSESICNVTK